MKAMMLTGINEMALCDVPSPQVKTPGDVLLRMTSVGVCGSDIHYYTTGRIGSQVVEYPFTVGHECAGVVEEVGCDVTRVKVGDLIAVEPAMPCFDCDQCKAGRENTCRNLRFLGCPGQAEGCLSEYIVMPEPSCIALPEGVTSDGAAFSEPLSIGVYAVRQSINMKGAKVGILGSGPIGLSVLYSAMARGAAACYMTDLLDDRVAFAKANGATWACNPDETDVVEEILAHEPGGLDVVFECSGQQDAVDQALQLLKPGGKLMMIGIPEFERFSFTADLIRRKELCIQNVRRQNKCVEEALEMIAQGHVPIDKLCTHSFSFRQTQEAFDLVAGYRDGVVKAMIQM